MTSLVLGYAGLREFVPELNHRLAGKFSFSSGPLDLLYYDLQLFVVNSLPVSYGGPYPWTLEIARFGAPAATVYALVATMWLLLDTKLQQLRVRLARGHVVICAGGASALQLGDHLRRDGRRVVVVDEGLSPAAARAAGLLHVAGDPRDEHVLRRAGLSRAAEVFILHEESAASAAMVLTAARLAHPNGSPTCYAAIADQEVYAGLSARHFGWPAEHRLRLNLFNPDELAALALLEAEPPPADVEGGHVVVVGMGGLGQALLVEVARRRRATFPGGGRLLVTAVDAGAAGVVARLQRQAPFMLQTCQVHALGLAADGLDEESLTRLLSAGPQPDRVYVCCDDEGVALRIALRTLRARYQRSLRVVVYVERGSALSAAFHGDDRLFDDARGTLRVLALRDLWLRPEHIRGSLLTERLARELHASYLEACLRTEAMGSRAALRPWEQLAEKYRESNRDLARHVGEKLAAINCILVPAFDPSHTFAYRDEQEVGRLAMMEHERWVREREGQGFVHGPVRQGRFHPDLVPWEQLPEDAREKDAQLVRELPRILSDAGFQVLRVAAPA